jgi:tRNA A-37 threonylcarbamoyl transferase component Bud32
LNLYKSAPFRIEPLWGIPDYLNPHLNYQSLVDQINQILNSFPKDAHILLVNGNQGYLALHLAKQNFQVTVLEPNESNYDLIVALKKRYEIQENLTIIKWENIEKIPDIEETFDLVICAHTFLLSNINNGINISKELFKKIKENYNYILIIELRSDHNKWWNPYAEKIEFNATYSKKYYCLPFNNRIIEPEIHLISETNFREFTFFDEPKEIIRKHNQADSRNEYITVYQSNTKIIKEIKIINSAENEALNLQKVPKKIRNKLKLPSKYEIKQSGDTISYIREKINGEIADESIEIKPKHVQNFIKIICQYSKFGYFHNDLRPWNVIVNDEEIALIDFEFLSKIDKDPTEFPQWLAMLAILNFLQQKSPRTWNMDEFTAVASQKIDFRHLASQIYFERAWSEIHRHEKYLEEMDFSDVSEAIENVKKLIDKKYENVFLYWNSDSVDVGNE